jgi:hypothetical protein
MARELEIPSAVFDLPYARAFRMTNYAEAHRDALIEAFPVMLAHELSSMANEWEHDNLFEEASWLRARIEEIRPRPPSG